MALSEFCKTCGIKLQRNIFGGLQGIELVNEKRKKKNKQWQKY